MKIYLVGGAIRNELLQIPVKERDYLVIGSTIKEMIDAGYRLVGDHFPVFLHPETQEEYALARTERKSGQGYKGFRVFSDPNITVEEDLKRRDLTINAIAQDQETGELIDPFGGKEDIRNRILRHISPAFREDPLRLLRIARFASTLPDFTIARKTITLLIQMSRSGELTLIAIERIRSELERSLMGIEPERFFLVLNRVGALEILFPEFLNYFPKELSKRGEWMIRLLKETVKRSSSLEIRIIALLFPVNCVDPKAVKNFLKRFLFKKELSDLLHLSKKPLQSFLNLDSSNPELILNLLEKLDSFRRPKRFNLLLSFWNLVLDVARPISSSQSKKIALLTNINKRLLNTKINRPQGHSGPEIKLHIRKERLSQISRMITDSDRI